VIAVLGGATFQRNRVWSSNVSLWEDVVRKSPGKARGYNNLGAALSDAGRNEEAIAALRQALAINPEHTEAFYNLGRVYLTYPDRIGDAIAVLKRAIELKPDYDDAYVNLAAAYIRGGKPAEAVRFVENVIARSADRPDAHFNLGVAYFLAGNIQGAMQEAAVLRQLDPQLAGQLEQFMSRSR
jgi:tetratricopeptide (TPR) repeat protein